MQEFSQAPLSNKEPGPIHLVEMSIPRDILGVSKQATFDFIKKHIPTNLTWAFDVDTDGRSDQCHFRGFRREKEFHDSLMSHRYSSAEVLDNLHLRGHELLVNSEDGSIKTSDFPKESISFAIPNETEIGYLVIYDNRDGFFDKNKFHDWASQTDLKPNSTLRDKVIAVIRLVSETQPNLLRIIASMFKKIRNPHSQK